MADQLRAGLARRTGDGRSYRAALIEKMLDLALRADSLGELVSAMRFCFDRLEGKPREAPPPDGTDWGAYWREQLVREAAAFELFGPDGANDEGLADR